MIIPLGDHCAISIILKELNLRQKSYPFDWVVNHEQLYDTNLIYNINIIKELLATNNLQEITTKYLGNAFFNNMLNTNNNIWFPHDNIHEESLVYDKYMRRFERLYNDIKSNNNIFIMITRCYYIEENIFNEFMEILLQNKNNKIIFISGINHEYLIDVKYNINIIFKFIYYDINQYYSYDYSHFRPQIKEYLQTLNLINRNIEF